MKEEEGRRDWRL